MWRAPASATAELWFGSASSSAEDDAAFAGYSRDRTALNVRYMAPLVVLAALLWWPLDFVFFDDAGTQARLALWRLGGGALCLACFTLFLGVEWARARPVLVYGALATAGTFLTAALLAGAGGESRPFLQGSYLAPWLSFIYFGPLAGRATVTALILAGWLAGTAAFHPETLDSPHFANAVAYLVFSAALCVVASHIIYRLSRHAFLQERALEARVAERTQDLQALAARLTTVLEDERSRIAREIHDELGQALSAIRLEVEVSQAHLGAAGPEAAALEGSLQRLTRLVGETLATSRSLLSQLRPRVLDALGLSAALSWLVGDFRGRHGLACSLSIEPRDLDVEPARALALFRIVQECLTNVVRHARASEVEIALRDEGGVLHLSVADDGVGGAGSVRGRGVGMVGMRERALQFGGKLHCESPPGKGTVVSVRLPAPAPPHREEARA